MSIVRYNDKLLSVVHHNKSLNSVVIYNSETENLELVKLDHDESNGSHSRRRRSIPSQFEFVCPDCGYQCNINPPSSNESPRRSSGSDFLRNDYFRLLARADSGNESNKELISTLIHQAHPADIDQIPVELINQGYFKKFFSVLGDLGNGSNGKVLKVEHKLFNLQLGIFALKKIAIGNHFGNLVRILNEVKFLYSLTESSNTTNANIIKYNHVWLEVDQISSFGPQVPVVFILFEYCDGGTLEQFIEHLLQPKFDIKLEKMRRRMKKKGIKGAVTDRRYLNNFEIYKIFKDVLNGLHHLHEQKTLHRDLKPSNCLFKTKFPDDYQPIDSVDDLGQIPNLVVSDFGESIMENSKRNSTGCTGTLEFCAPELFEEVDPGQLHDFSYYSDVYSLGMILYYICFGKLPFKSSDQNAIREEIVSCNLFEDMDKLRRGELLPDYLRLIRLMCDPDAKSRPTCEQVMLQMEHIHNKLAKQSYKKFALARTLWQTGLNIAQILLNIWLCPYPALNNLQFVLVGVLISQKKVRYLMWVEISLTILFLALSIDSYWAAVFSSSDQ
ncbi:hypothetical protein KL906_000832 [Ogataea polymorpha]|uniref:Uncharacterized protein n=1 Tax=Ogataea polymorpha TaxID=460523 RepID=A0A1B7SIY1_9ASCO|nr:uncharacterized protein OGAPODRAFT_16118 [Ogataea polymorpha]KAG7882252.1 hypothetical protein KL937_000823 [Ogataea polymorpha]KAG7911511.1 hypothetical protein KL906_000832 [Ogataea polymorpha]KAG7919270.1 hypothetical protein KL927_001399 [Ogataea polymorpha]KAG7937172.1 hypothetical protein KL934_001375 [Ogataea polymorpha]KAG7939882.1 hypothetical protein KL904_000820 [Ogataea polymorpha]